MLPFPQFLQIQRDLPIPFSHISFDSAFRPQLPARSVAIYCLLRNGTFGWLALSLLRSSSTVLASTMLACRQLKIVRFHSKAKRAGQVAWDTLASCSVPSPSKSKLGPRRVFVAHRCGQSLARLATLTPGFPHCISPLMRRLKLLEPQLINEAY